MPLPDAFRDSSQARFSSPVYTNYTLYTVPGLPLKEKLVT